MPSVVVRSFSDPDDYAASIRGAHVQLTITGRGHFIAKIVRVELASLWMQRLSDNLPRIAHTATTPGRTYITFRTSRGPSLLWRGLEMQPTGIIRHNEAPEYFQRSSGSTGIGAMSLPVEEMAAAGAAIAGCDLTPPPDGQMLIPPPLAMARLQRLHEAVGRLAEEAPEIIADPGMARGLKQSLIQVVVDCLGTANCGVGSAARRRHQAIMRRFHAVLEEHPDRALYLPELCAMLGVPQRTLRRCCVEHLGIGPMRFLLLRRMHLARRALREGDAASTTVTAIAGRFGFWEFGQFSVAYKSLFRESPSLTLRRPPELRPERRQPGGILAEIA